MWRIHEIHTRSLYDVGVINPVKVTLTHTHNDNKNNVSLKGLHSFLIHLHRQIGRQSGLPVRTQQTTQKVLQPEKRIVRTFSFT